MTDDDIFKMLDTSFLDQARYFTQELDNLRNDAYDMVAERAELKFEDAYALVEEWLSSL